MIDITYAEGVLMIIALIGFGVALLGVTFR